MLCKLYVQVSIIIDFGEKQSDIQDLFQFTLIFAIVYFFTQGFVANKNQIEYHVRA